MHGSKNHSKDHVHAHQECEADDKEIWNCLGCKRPLRSAAFDAFNDPRVVLIWQVQQKHESPEFSQECNWMNREFVT